MSATAQLRLMAWLSPAFPVGSFSYSHGLERAVDDGLVADRAALKDWIALLLSQGSGWNDAVLLAAAWKAHADAAELAEIAGLAEALAASAERYRESMLQGAAFLQALSNWPGLVRPPSAGDHPYCVAFGAVAGANGIEVDAALSAFLQAFASTLIQAAIRLGVIGQGDAIAALATLEPLCLATADRAAMATLDDLGSAAFQSDIVAMTHETQYSRLFRS